MWVEESLLVPPAKAQSPKRGHPLVYTDALIQGLLGLKQVRHRSGHPCGRAQPHGGARSPAIRPYRLSPASPRSACFQSRFMQQRHTTVVS